jgi:hypothetical protein
VPPPTRPRPTSKLAGRGNVPSFALGLLLAPTASAVSRLTRALPRGNAVTSALSRPSVMAAFAVALPLAPLVGSALPRATRPTLPLAPSTARPLLLVVTPRLASGPTGALLVSARAMVSLCPHSMLLVMAAPLERPSGLASSLPPLSTLPPPPPRPTSTPPSLALVLRGSSPALRPRPLLLPAPRARCILCATTWSALTHLLVSLPFAACPTLSLTATTSALANSLRAQRRA